MSNSNFYLFPIIGFIAFSLGWWILGKNRNWIFKIAVSTIPYVPLAALIRYIFSTDINLILLYWIVYLLLLWLNPSLYYFQILDYYRLRKQSIRKIGWITGNAKDIPYWKCCLDEESHIYQKLFQENTTKNMENEYNLYREWEHIGYKRPYNEKKCRKEFKKAKKHLKKSDKSYKSAYDFLPADSELRKHF